MKGEYYFPMRIRSWSSLTVDVMMDMPSDIDTSELPSGGFLPVYTSMAGLLRDYPSISTDDIMVVRAKD